MNVPYTRAPHQGGTALAGADSTHAALLIDFDNVTMGMRSDLSKELKTLLDTDVIKGKVSVQRAYADWRRYPQYIVPLSEASVDLIFAPAYGSNKKNATDIRMAIDALELVFIRPEIGTFILLTGDSDFSSLVLKLKEYGKYVIGVGIQESSSDILVQNCDEYYSYTSLTGLTKTTELSGAGRDPWILVKDAVAKMVQRNDVMRSDRLKQVMQEIDSAFDEGSIGFSKFSKFLAEASSRGLVSLRKLDNGQYEVEQVRGRSGGGSSRSSDDGGRGRRDRGRGGRRGGRDRGSRDSGSGSGGRSETSDAPTDAKAETDGPSDPLRDAYDVLTEALRFLEEAGRAPARDSDVKRKMLERNPRFDETELGFPKFSKFLAQADEHGVVSLARSDAGNLDVSLADESDAGSGASKPAVDTRNDRGLSASQEQREPSRSEDRTSRDEPTSRHDGSASGDAGTTSSTPDPAKDDADDATAKDDVDNTTAKEQSVIEVEPPKRGWFGLRLGPRRGSTRRRGADDAPTLLEGQVVDPQDVVSEAAASEAKSEPAPEAPTSREADRSTHDPAPDEPSHSSVTTGNGAGTPSADGIEGLGLPTDDGAIVRYLAHRYKGVGEKTAETLVEKLGTDLFRTMHEDPDAIARIVPPKRAEQVLDAWRADYERRVASKRGGRS